MGFQSHRKCCGLGVLQRLHSRLLKLSRSESLRAMLDAYQQPALSLRAGDSENRVHFADRLLS